MYPIAYVFYGIELTKEIEDFMNKAEEEENSWWIEDDGPYDEDLTCGFITPYTGNLEPCGYSGILIREYNFNDKDLTTAISDAKKNNKIKDLKLEFKKYWDYIPKELQDFIKSKNLHKPAFGITWGTS